MILKNNFYIITGGPGVGKTSLINELTKREYNCVPEVAREIIKEQMANDGDALPWKDIKKYSDLMLSYSVRDFIYLSDKDDLHFFDRGIPDTYGYELLMKFDTSEKLMETLAEYRYNRIAFILPPWKEIYETDNERKQDFQTAIDTYNIMKVAYENAGYSLIEVPVMSISQRADFVLNEISV
jgi:predicted ATPase